MLQCGTGKLRPRHRLRSSADFRRVMRGGPRVADPTFSLRWAARGAPDQRLGISIPRRAGPAVLRNRTRRVIREMFRLGRENFPDGADIVVAVRSGANLRGLRGWAIRLAIRGLADQARALQRRSGASGAALDDKGASAL